MTTIESVVDVGKFLLHTLPDLIKEPPEEFEQLKCSVLNEMKREWSPAFAHFGVELPEPGDECGLPASTFSGHEDARYYVVKATHSRTDGLGQHSFTGEVPMARITLPEDHDAHVINGNALGAILDGDHFLHSKALFEHYYEDYMDFAIDHVDLITPVRFLGYRFAAVALYLVYDEMGYRTFVFEGGMATGKPRVLYASRDGEPLDDRRSGYRPTPMSSIDHIYSGTVTFHPDSGEFAGFRIQIREEKEPKDNHFFTLDAVATPIESVDPVFPPMLVLQAAMRVAAIMDAQGKEVPGLGVLTPVVAAAAREKYQWTKEPQK